MNYYERHLGDYARDTSHLSLIEHGVYTVMMDRYYATESGIPAEQIFRICRARTKEEKIAVETISREFFSLEDGVYKHSRIEGEIEKARSRIDAARGNGKKGGRPKKNPPGSSGLTMGSEIETQSKAPHAPCSMLHVPEDQKQTTSSVSVKPTPAPDDVLGSNSENVPVVDKVARIVVDAYHETLPRCLRIEVMSPKRVKRIVAANKLAKTVCQQQSWDFETRSFWLSYFGECLLDPWLRGEVPNPKNVRWKQNLHVLIEEDRFAEIMDRAITRMEREG